MSVSKPRMQVYFPPDGLCAGSLRLGKGLLALGPLLHGRGWGDWGGGGVVPTIQVSIDGDLGVGTPEKV